MRSCESGAYSEPDAAWGYGERMSGEALPEKMEVDEEEVEWTKTVFPKIWDPDSEYKWIDSVDCWIWNWGFESDFNPSTLGSALVCSFLLD